MTTRRSFLASLLAVSAAPATGWAAVGDPAYLAAAKQGDGSFTLIGLRDDGAEAFRVPLPARGHAACAHPSRAEAVGFARRPGTYALVIDCITGALLHELSAPEGHSFNGHGAFSADGTVLFTSEQEAEGSAGRIGIWDVEAGYKRVSDFPTHGLGPHEMRLMPDGQSLVVANGGIQTDAWDRTKLNIDSMKPNLSYVGLNGTLMEMVELEEDLHQNSIRHLALRADGLVGFCMQWQGEPGAATPLLGLHRRGEAPVLCEAPLADELAMNGYAGSVAFSGDGQEIAITSPRGGRIHRFSEAGAFLGAVSRTDVCGLATHEGGYIASDGLGGLIELRGDAPRALRRAEVAWDNHLVRIAG
ncbi:twin-arginine translocation pathway signal [Salipiger sp. CCB-MM3]|uniref:DUF1513 domain-containing protein n=1 Tax=Salipiger sp. CCB-MM3 TaxID=1792508 RepID=UPI00080A96A8|nr:DUF1513 domain-containing protein [Salipiger sp. CCB-MM3]ANT61287.1 twin-arginine translocation pathway signal [Salipiger sp. CCB-MM3]